MIEGNGRANALGLLNQSLDNDSLKGMAQNELRHGLQIFLYIFILKIILEAVASKKS